MFRDIMGYTTYLGVSARAHFHGYNHAHLLVEQHPQVVGGKTQEHHRPSFCMEKNVIHQ